MPPTNEGSGHDWRVNPFLILPSNPPKLQLVCADCGARKHSGPIGTRTQDQTNKNDPSTWPRFKEAAGG